MNPRRGPELLVATRSEGKLRELVPMLEAAGFRALTLEGVGLAPTPDEDAIECYDSFEANALAKVRWFSVRSGGRVVLADDSGLSVDALGGAPGVRSKRWAADGRNGAVVDGSALEDAALDGAALNGAALDGAALDGAALNGAALNGAALNAANNARLVREMLPHANRTARYVCVAAIGGPGVELLSRGECIGRILGAPSGARGFGYDPYFFSDELGESFGTAPLAAKERVSHRGRAVRAVLARYVRKRESISPSG